MVSLECLIPIDLELSRTTTIWAPYNKAMLIQLPNLEGMVIINLEKPTIKKNVYDALYEDIVEGRYNVHDILTEGMLTEKYGVSKSPVREALIELCKDKTLRSIPRMGYQILPISLKDVIDVLDYRVDLEVCNLRRAFEHFGEKEIENLLSISSDPVSGHDREVMPNWLLNQHFHLEICRIGGNNYAYQMLEATLQRSARIASQYYKTAWAKASESQGKYHRAIIQSIIKHDLPTAEEMLRKDILVVKHEIMNTLS